MGKYKEHRTRYSPVANLSVLHQLHAEDCLTGYLLLLAHEVAADMQGYMEFVEMMRDEYEDAFIILDNGTVELGQPWEPCEWPFQDIIERLNPDCYVLPDAIQSFAETEKLITRNLEAINDIDVPFMALPQGADHIQLIACAQWMMEELPWVEHPKYGQLWGVPRWIGNKMGSRKPFTQHLQVALRAAKKKFAIHQFGMSENFVDDIESASMTPVLGIDSANPVLLGQRGIDMSKAKHIQHIGRTDALWKETFVENETCSNVRFVQSHLDSIHPDNIEV